MLYSFQVMLEKKLGGMKGRREDGRGRTGGGGGSGGERGR